MLNPKENEIKMKECNQKNEIENENKNWYMKMKNDSTQVCCYIFMIKKEQRKTLIVHQVGVSHRFMLQNQFAITSCQVNIAHSNFPFFFLHITVSHFIFFKNHFTLNLLHRFPFHSFSLVRCLLFAYYFFLFFFFCFVWYFSFTWLVWCTLLKWICLKI